MATDLSGSNYSETDASNNNAAPNGMPENMAPSGVNDAWRQHAGATKRAWDRDHATATVGGTANAVTLTYSVGPASYVTGEKFSFKATAANTAATTVNVSGLGAKNVFRKTGAGVAACLGGEIQSGDIVELEYDGTQMQIIGGAASVAKQQTRQVLTSGTGATYTTPTGATRINVRMVGGGGGGGGATANNGNNGTASTWSGGSLSAGGAGGGTAGGAPGGGGGSSANGDINMTGNAGQSAVANGGSATYGGYGGASHFGGAGQNPTAAAGGPAATGGSGGAGGGNNAGAAVGSGGGAGGYCEKLIVAPAATYTYTVGAGGNGGAAGGFAGGNGGSGLIIVDEYYN